MADIQTHLIGSNTGARPMLCTSLRLALCASLVVCVGLFIDRHGRPISDFMDKQLSNF